MGRVALQTPAPEFTLPDANGMDVSLSSFKGRSHVVLVFNRGFT